MDKTYERTLIVGKYMAHRANGLGPADVARLYGVSYGLVWNLLEEIAAKNGVSRESLLKFPHSISDQSRKAMIEGGRKSKRGDGKMEARKRIVEDMGLVPNTDEEDIESSEFLPNAGEDFVDTEETSVVENPEGVVDCEGPEILADSEESEFQAKPEESVNFPDWGKSENSHSISVRKYLDKLAAVKWTMHDIVACAEAEVSNLRSGIKRWE